MPQFLAVIGAMVPFTYEVVTPQTAVNRTVHYGFHTTPYGQCLLGVTAQGVCWSAFVTSTPAQALTDLQAAFDTVSLQENLALTGEYVKRIFAPDGIVAAAPVHLLLRGTAFQVRVWEVLLRIPAGKFVSYQDLARALGAPAAVRAVGTACGRNTLAFLVPCHRVVRKTGSLGGYRWGLARKQAMLAREAAQAAA